MVASPKSNIVRDRPYLDSIRDMECVVTGRCGTDHETVDPAHLRWGTGGGTAMKPSDVYVNPLIHSQHIRQGEMGEQKYWLDAVNKDPIVLRDFMRDALEWRYFKRTGKMP